MSLGFNTSNQLLFVQNKVLNVYNEFWTDSEGNVYPVVDIGTQKWLASNLKLDIAGSAVMNDDPSNEILYGRLYKWSMMADIDSAISGTGWHVPSQTEMDDLITFTGGISDAGGALKEVANRTWNSPSAGTNAFRFNLLGAGMKGRYGPFYSFNDSGYLWTSTEYDAVSAKGYQVNNTSNSISVYNFDKGEYFSVRLIHD